MQLPSIRRQSRRGHTLLLVMVIGGAMAITIGSIFSLTGASLRLAYGRSDWQAAFYNAENALQWAPN